LTETDLTETKLSILEYFLPMQTALIFLQALRD